MKSRAGKTQLLVTLSDSGAQKLEHYSQSHVGERLALMLDERLLSTPKIRVPIHGKAFQIDQLSPEEAEQAAALINRKTTI